jgi:hypothetical protein
VFCHLYLWQHNINYCARRPKAICCGDSKKVY